MSNNKLNWNTERLLSLSAMSVSVITLLIFVYQTNLMRKQNYLSILPYLMLSTTNNDGESTFELNLKNHGVGPAIIESAILSYKGERYKLKAYEDNIHDLLTTLAPDLDSLKFFSFATLNKGLAIPAGTSYSLIQVNNSPEDYQLITTTLQQLLEDGLNYEIIYKSIQGERWLIREDSEGPEAL